jgi:hypothetical protein
VSRDIPEFVGVWILRSLQLENPETGQRIDAYGPKPVPAVSARETDRAA